jgi:hypothetical protein
MWVLITKLNPWPQSVCVVVLGCPCLYSKLLSLSIGCSHSCECCSLCISCAPQVDTGLWSLLPVLVTTICRWPLRKVNRSYISLYILLIGKDSPDTGHPAPPALACSSGRWRWFPVPSPSAGLSPWPACQLYLRAHTTCCLKNGCHHASAISINLLCPTQVSCTCPIILLLGEPWCTLKSVQMVRCKTCSNNWVRARDL